MTELLGSDLMEHNILHGGIGIDEALETLNRLYLLIYLHSIYLPVYTLPTYISTLYLLIYLFYIYYVPQLNSLYLFIFLLYLLIYLLYLLIYLLYLYLPSLSKLSTPQVLHN